MPIWVRTRQEVVYKKLETAILSGHIRPGDRLITDEIAKRLGVSKIPVREALRGLEAGGLISTKPNYGSTVSELSKENLEEILKLRINLECMTARKAAQTKDADLLDRLNSYHQQFASARASNLADKLLQSNKKFHHTLYQAAGMPILLNLIEQLWDRVSPYYYILFRQSVKPNPVIGIHYHQEIVNAVKNKDPDAVSRWIEADLTDSTRFVLSIFDEAE
jgi:DNA-binding GntR family transcriptional regulator